MADGWLCQVRPHVLHGNVARVLQRMSALPGLPGASVVAEQSLTRPAAHRARSRRLTGEASACADSIFNSSIVLMSRRSVTSDLKRRFGPHPMHTPRTAWQRFNRAKTDSGWLLLLLNFLTLIVFGAIFTHLAISRHGGISTLYWYCSVGNFLGVLRTAYVMVCVARGQTGQLAPAASGTSSGKQNVGL